MFSEDPESRVALDAAYAARRDGAVMAAVAEVVEQGRAAVTHDDADPEHPWTDLPDGFDYPALINDAFDDAPIVGPFLPPDAPWPFCIRPANRVPTGTAAR